MTRLAIIFSLLFVTPAWAEIVLYCQDELANGISKRDGAWGEHSFKLNRHTLKFDEEAGTLNGLSWREMSCEKLERKPEVNRNSEIQKCVGFRYVFYLNTDSLRFSIYEINFLYALDANFGGESISRHGTCEKF